MAEEYVFLLGCSWLRKAYNAWSVKAKIIELVALRLRRLGAFVDAA